MWLDNAVDEDVGGMHSAWLLAARIWLLAQPWLLGCLAARMVGWVAGWLDPIASWPVDARVWLLIPGQDLGMDRNRLAARMAMIWQGTKAWGSKQGGQSQDSYFC